MTKRAVSGLIAAAIGTMFLFAGGCCHMHRHYGDDTSHCNKPCCCKPCEQPCCDKPAPDCPKSEQKKQ